MIFKNVQAVCYWLFVEPKYFWIAFIVPIVFVFLGLFWAAAPSDDSIRRSGLVIQLFGIGTAVWGILDTEKLFGLVPLKFRFKAWLYRCPLLRRESVSGAAMGTEGSDTGAAPCYTLWELNSDAPIEKRLDTLEKNIPLLNDRITNMQKEFDAAVQQLQQQLNHANNRNEQDIRHVDDRLFKFGTGSLHIAAMGAFWVFLGTILSTASHDIYVLLK